MAIVRYAGKKNITKGRSRVEPNRSMKEKEGVMIEQNNKKLEMAVQYDEGDREKNSKQSRTDSYYKGNERDGNIRAESLAGRRHRIFRDFSPLKVCSHRHIQKDSIVTDGFQKSIKNDVDRWYYSRVNKGPILVSAIKRSC